MGCSTLWIFSCDHSYILFCGLISFTQNYVQFRHISVHACCPLGGGLAFHCASTGHLGGFTGFVSGSGLNVHRMQVHFAFVAQADASIQSQTTHTKRSQTSAFLPVFRLSWQFTQDSVCGSIMLCFLPNSQNLGGMSISHSIVMSDSSYSNYHKMPEAANLIKRKGLKRFV